MTRAQDRALIDAYLAGSNTAGTQLIRNYDRLLWREAHRFFKGSRGVEVEDLYQTAVCGFLRAIQTYDETKSCLMTYALHWIRERLRRTVSRSFTIVCRPLSGDVPKIYATMGKIVDELNASGIYESGTIIATIADRLGIKYSIVERVYHTAYTAITTDDLLVDHTTPESEYAAVETAIELTKSRKLA